MKKLLIGLIAVAAILLMARFFSACNIVDGDVVDGKIGKVCPKCKSDSTATIMYGLLTPDERANPDSFQDVMRQQKMVVGGCIVRSEKYYCYNCGHRW